MNYEKINSEHLFYFSHIIGKEHVIIDNELLYTYAKDETEDLVFLPEVVLKPKNTTEISQILAYCNTENIAVTPRGAGTGLSGGALPVKGGVVLCTSRMNKIIDIDIHNMQATVEPGVITEALQEAVAALGLCYPPDPSSKGSCTMGGNWAENAGGPKAVKYGTTKDYILNLEVVLANGEVLWTGANVLKNATGYNLTQLLVGAEGTLGIITKGVVRLVPKPKHNLLMMASFNSLEQACMAVNTILNGGITPSALEFMERIAIDWSAAYLNYNLNLNADVKAQLLIELDGNHKAELWQEAEWIANALEPVITEEIQIADTAEHQAALWKIRRNIAHAVKANSIYKEEDTVVPRAHLPELITVVKNIGLQYGFTSVCYGHAGDGNVHVNIIKGDLTDQAWNQIVNEGIKEIFKAVKRLNGTLSGEHGIGWVQKKYMNTVLDPINIQIMQQIKQIFDPKHILNPMKLFPD